MPTCSLAPALPCLQPTRWDLLKHGAVLKLASAVPFGKWKALMGCGLDLERQKMAFLKVCCLFKSWLHLYSSSC